MEVTIFFVLLCGMCTALPYSHNIPVEGYETALENLGEHVEIPETPIKVIKITKTIAVKVPVPYPVKVIERVPYPVNVHKPYPVQVPQIVKVPHGPKAVHQQEEQSHEPIDVQHRTLSFQNIHALKLNDAQYQIKEEQEDPTEQHYDKQSDTTKNSPPSDGNYEQKNKQFGISNEYASDDLSEPFVPPVSNYYGYSGDDGNIHEPPSYGQKLTSDLPSNYPSFDYNPASASYYRH